MSHGHSGMGPTPSPGTTSFPSRFLCFLGSPSKLLPAVNSRGSGSASGGTGRQTWHEMTRLPQLACTLGPAALGPSTSLCDGDPTAWWGRTQLTMHSVTWSPRSPVGVPPRPEHQEVGFHKGQTSPGEVMCSPWSVRPAGSNFTRAFPHHRHLQPLCPGSCGPCSRVAATRAGT